MHRAVGSMLVAVRRTVSPAGLPVAVRRAPPVFAELLQPRLTKEGALPHGQLITPSRPGLQKLVKGSISYSAPSMSPLPAALAWCQTTNDGRSGPPEDSGHATRGWSSTEAEKARLTWPSAASRCEPTIEIVEAYTS